MVQRVAESLTSNKKRFLGILAGACILCFTAGYLIAAQPHMQAALQHLKSARTQLQKSSHNKGGHRVKALSLVNQAISEVNKGIAAGSN
jgi:hypothetical protein